MLGRMLLEPLTMVVSAASISHLPDNICRGRSLIYIENKSGPNTQPCGTPHTTGCQIQLPERTTGYRTRHLEIVIFVVEQG